MKSRLANMSTILLFFLLSFGAVGPSSIPSESPVQYISRGTTGDYHPPSDSILPGGALQWTAILIEGEPVSTPCLTDLDGNGDLEIVAASAGDGIYALRSNGSYFWESPYDLDSIEPVDHTISESEVEYEPPPLFGSVSSLDILSDARPEVIMAVWNGFTVIDSEGRKRYKASLTTGHYSATPTVTDLEGDWTEEEQDREIVVVSNGDGTTAWIEAYETDGGALFRTNMQSRTNSPLATSSIVSQDLDGDFYDGKRRIDPVPGKERDSELVACYPGVPLSVFTRNGINDGIPNYDQTVLISETDALVFGTPAIANISGPRDLEIVVPICRGKGNWTNWTGEISVFSPNGSKLWEYQLEGKGSGVVSSPVIAEIHKGYPAPFTGNPNLDLIFGSDNGILYVVSTRTHSLLWSFDTGGRILSSPAVCNIDNDDELEILVGSDSGRIYCLDGNPTDGKDEGVAFPGDGTEYDVLWYFYANISIGISSPVIADIDLDGQLEVVIGDTEGHLYCISTGGRCYKGQADWPKFHYDPENTGFFNPQPDASLDIYLRPDPLTDLKSQNFRYVQPGSNASFDLSIELKGRRVTEGPKATVHLLVEQLPLNLDWTYELIVPTYKGNERPDYVKLAPEEKVNITLVPKAPWKGRTGDIVIYNIFASMEPEYNISDSISVYALFDNSINFAIDFNAPIGRDPLSGYCGMDWIQMEPGSEVSVPLIIENRGDLNDSYAITLIRPENRFCEWFFMETNGTTLDVSLPSLRDGGPGASNRTIKMIKIFFPQDPEGMDISHSVLLHVKGISRSLMPVFLKKVERSDELFVLIRERIRLPSFVFEEPIFYMMPGETGSSRLVLFPLYNGEYQAKVSASDVPAGWNVSFPEGDLITLTDQRVYLGFIIDAPNNSKIGDAALIRFTASLVGAGETYLPYSDVLTVVIGRDHWFGMDLKESEFEAAPGEIVDTFLGITSYWYSDMELDLEVRSNESGWGISFSDRTGKSLERVYLPSLESITLKITVEIPPEALNMTYEITIMILSDGFTASDVIRIDVAQIFDLVIVVSDPVMEFLLEEEKDTTVIILNRGNGIDSFNLFMGAFDGSEGLHALGLRVIGVEKTGPINEQNLSIWDEACLSEEVGSSNFTYEPITSRFHLGPRESGVITIRLRAPERTLLRTFRDLRLKVDAVRTRPWKVISASIGLKLLYPDLTVVGDIKIGNGTFEGIMPQDEVQIVFDLINQGDIPALNVEILLKEDGVVYEMRSMGDIENDGEVRSVVFNYTAKAGSHTLIVEIDPLNQVIENRDQFMDQGISGDNVHTIFLEVGTEQDRVTLDWSALVISSILILAALLFAVVFAFLGLTQIRRGHNPNDRVEE